MLKDVHTVVLAGHAAGDDKIYNHSLVYGQDDLISVHHVGGENLALNNDIANEFTIVGNNLINNIGGTDTTNGRFVVTFLRR